MNRAWLFVITVLAWGLFAKAVAARKERERPIEGPAARLSEAPASARSLKNPYKDDPRAVAAGRKLFLRYCAECHGRQGYGNAHAANLHPPAFQKAPPGVLFWTIRNGRLPGECRPGPSFPTSRNGNW
jgi:mono/diheme cytochrome c family protein